MASAETPAMDAIIARAGLDYTRLLNVITYAAKQDVEAIRVLRPPGVLDDADKTLTTKARDLVLKSVYTEGTLSVPGQLAVKGTTVTRPTVIGLEEEVKIQRLPEEWNILGGGGGKNRGGARGGAVQTSRLSVGPRAATCEYTFEEDGWRSAANRLSFKDVSSTADVFEDVADTRKRLSFQSRHGADVVRRFSDNLYSMRPVPASNGIRPFSMYHPTSKWKIIGGEVGETGGVTDSTGVTLLSRLASGLTLTNGLMAPRCASGSPRPRSTRGEMTSVLSAGEFARMNIDTRRMLQPLLKHLVSTEVDHVLAAIRPGTKWENVDSWFLDDCMQRTKQSEGEDSSWFLMVSDMPILDEDVQYRLAIDLSVHVTALLTNAEDLAAAMKGLRVAHLMVSTLSAAFATRAAFVDATFDLCEWPHFGVDPTSGRFEAVKTSLVGHLSALPPDGVHGNVWSVPFSQWVEESGVTTLVAAEVLTDSLVKSVLEEVNNGAALRKAPLTAATMLMEARTPHLFYTFPRLAAASWLQRCFMIDMVSIRPTAETTEQLPSSLRYVRRQKPVSLHQAAAVRDVTTLFDRETLSTEELIPETLEGMIVLKRRNGQRDATLLDVHRLGTADTCAVFTIRCVFVMPSPSCTWTMKVAASGPLDAGDYKGVQWGWGNTWTSSLLQYPPDAVGVNKDACVLVGRLRMCFVRHSAPPTSGTLLRLKFSTSCTFFRRSVLSTSEDKARLSLRTEDAQRDGYVLRVLGFETEVRQTSE